MIIFYIVKDYLKIISNFYEIVPKAINFSTTKLIDLRLQTYKLLKTL